MVVKRKADSASGGIDFCGVAEGFTPFVILTLSGAKGKDLEILRRVVPQDDREEG